MKTCLTYFIPSHFATNNWWMLFFLLKFCNCYVHPMFHGVFLSSGWGDCLAPYRKPASSLDFLNQIWHVYWLMDYVCTLNFSSKNKVHSLAFGRDLLQ